jgi:isocitrate dehydrogenase (NAD+)
VKTVTLIPGDGAGPELAAAARRILDASGAKLQWEVVEDPEPAVTSVRKTRAGLLGTPRLAALIQEALDLFLTLVPCRTIEGVPTQPQGLEFDIVVLVAREIGERDACGRIAHAAFTYAAMHARRKVTLARGPGDQLLREATADAARNYPQIEFEDRDVTADADQAPNFDVILCSDVPLAEPFATLAGGIVPKIWMGERAALFGGNGLASMALASSLLLEHLNEAQASERVRRAVERALSEGPNATIDAILAALPRR